jgi:hypothetical protein
MSPRGRPFQQGNSFGMGPPRGSRNKTTAQARQLLDKYAEPVMRTAIAEALKGNTTMIRLVLERVLPSRREAPVTLGTLPTATAEEVSKVSEAVLRKVASGKLTIPEGVGNAPTNHRNRGTGEADSFIGV